MECDITWVEVFAPRPLGGNLLPVLSPADGADDDVLQTVAARFRQPETSFVQTADDDRADYRHRIFTVDDELPFAGHPSLGTAAAVAAWRGESQATYVQQTLSGLQSLDVELDGRHGVAAIVQNPPEFGDEPDVTRLLDAIGLHRRSLHPTLRPQVVSTGLPCLILPIADVEQLSRAHPSVSALARLLPSEGLGARTVYAVADAGDHWRARAFTPVVPIGEDAATGSAAGPFGAYLRRHLAVTTASVRQGVEIGSPSELHTDTSDGIRVSGAVRIVGTGRHEVPGRSSGVVQPQSGSAPLRMPGRDRPGSRRREAGDPDRAAVSGIGAGTMTTEVRPLAGRVALVTGVSRPSGIGLACARRLHERGATVFATGHAAHDAEMPWGRQPIGAAPFELHDHDLEDPTAPAALIDEVIDEHGAVDIVIAGHARSSHVGFAEVDAAELDRCWAANVRSVVLLAKRFAARHRPAPPEEPPRGRMVWFTSGQHLAPMDDEIAYAITKGALHQATRSIDRALGRRRIIANCINPGPVDTGYATGAEHARVAGMFPDGRWGAPDDVANLVEFLVDDGGAWIRGEVLGMEGGFDRYA